MICDMKIKKWVVHHFKKNKQFQYILKMTMLKAIIKYYLQ